MTRKSAGGTLKYIATLLWTLSVMAATLEPKCFLLLDEMNCVNATIGDLPNVTESAVKDVKFLDSKIPVLKKGDLSSFPELTDFVCLDCQLAVIERDSFSASTNLISLELYGNQLTVIDANVISDCPKIKNVVVAWNPSLILQEGAPFLISSTLKNLDLTGNELFAIFPATFSRLPALKTLSLASNSLYHVPPDAFSALKKLRAIDLSRNKFRTLPLSVLPGHVNEARLAWNPWRCDCFLHPLILWFKSSSPREEVRCFQPRGVKWQDFQPSNCTTEFVDAIRQRKLMNRNSRP